MSIKFDEVTRSIENYIIARMTLEKHFEKKGLIVSFVPKLSVSQLGNGAHVHLSLWKVDGVNQPTNISGDEFSIHQMSEAFHNFTAGVLLHYPALSQFMAPQHNSLRRIKSSSFVGNFVCWGIDNKETPIRAVAPITKHKK